MYSPTTIVPQQSRFLLPSRGAQNSHLVLESYPEKSGEILVWSNQLFPKWINSGVLSGRLCSENLKNF
jgi:hypothetical protein